MRSKKAHPFGELAWQSWSEDLFFGAWFAHRFFGRLWCQVTRDSPITLDGDQVFGSEALFADRRLAHRCPGPPSSRRGGTGTPVPEKRRNRRKQREPRRERRAFGTEVFMNFVLHRGMKC